MSVICSYKKCNEPVGSIGDHPDQISLYCPVHSCNVSGCTEPSAKKFHSLDTPVRFCNRHVCSTCTQYTKNVYCPNCQPKRIPPPPAADEEVVVTVERRRDSSPKRTVKRVPSTPRSSSAPPVCPPAPRKARGTDARVLAPYQPGDELLFPVQRLTKTCPCGGALRITNTELDRWRYTVITCTGMCGFLINRTLPKFKLSLEALKWGAEMPMGRFEANNFPPLQ